MERAKAYGALNALCCSLFDGGAEALLQVVQVVQVVPEASV